MQNVSKVESCPSEGEQSRASSRKNCHSTDCISYRIVFTVELVVKLAKNADQKTKSTSEN